jgi:hypothetical protein
MEPSKEEIVDLNVGGRVSTTYKSTLTAYPDTMLARMFSTSSGIPYKTYIKGKITTK